MTDSNLLLHAALEGLEAQRLRLEARIADIKAMLSGTSVAERPMKKKRVMSEAARQRIAATQKKRWAAFKKTKAS